MILICHVFLGYCSPFPSMPQFSLLNKNKVVGCCDHRPFSISFLQLDVIDNMAVVLLKRSTSIFYTVSQALSKNIKSSYKVSLYIFIANLASYK